MTTPEPLVRTFTGPQSTPPLADDVEWRHQLMRGPGLVPVPW